MLAKKRFYYYCPRERLDFLNYPGATPTNLAVFKITRLDLARTGIKIISKLGLDVYFFTFWGVENLRETLVAYK